MGASMLNIFFGRPAASFHLAARRRGLRARVAKILGPAAREICPDRPESILESRELFERAAMHAVVGDAGNLELSFGLVDMLANTIETLGLTRVSDVPDPFRRVWVSNEAGLNRRGVVLSCQAGEVAVFCPPGGQPLADIGSRLHLRYRGFSSSVGYELQLNDAVRLPGAYVMHLTRLGGSGAIGRDNHRYPVNLDAKLRVRWTAAPEGGAGFNPCKLLDISSGGVRLACHESHSPGEIVELEVVFPDGIREPFCVRCVISWVGAEAAGLHSLGMQFDEDVPQHSDRLARFLQQLRQADGGDSPPATDRLE